MGIIKNVQIVEKPEENRQAKVAADNAIYCVDCLTGLKKINDLSVDVCATTPPSFEEYLKTPTLGAGVGVLEDYILGLVGVFNEVKRVLKKDGLVWLRVYDSSGENGESLAVPHKLIASLIAEGWFLQKEILWFCMSPLEAVSVDGSVFSGNGKKDLKKERIFVLSVSPDILETRVPDPAAAVSFNKVENFYYLFSAVRADTFGFCLPKSCPAGGTILDPFMGSGDVAAICAEHTFSFIGFEIDRFASKATASRLFMESSAKSAEVAKAEVAKSADENREGEYFDRADDLI
jgi:site-specific DNA-methyltransferase (adenine-specific)